MLIDVTQCAIFSVWAKYDDIIPKNSKQQKCNQWVSTVLDSVMIDPIPLSRTVRSG